MMWVHIGLPKTGTTTLQEFLFAHHSEVHFWGKYLGRIMRHDPSHSGPLHWWDERYEAVADFISRPEPASDVTEWRARAVDLHLEAAAEGKPVSVLSKETLSLCGRPLRRARAEAIRALFGEARVLMTLRHPVDLTRSVYSQSLKREILRARVGPMPKVPHINKWLDTAFAKGRTAPTHHLDYAFTVRAFAQVFKPHVELKVVLFEEITRDSNLFGRRVCEIMEIDPDEGQRLTEGRRSNVGLSRGAIGRLAEIRRSLWKSWRFGLTKPKKRQAFLRDVPSTLPPTMSDAESMLSAASVARIAEVTRDGNRYLLEEWGLPVDRYGYPL
jgi:hypothetical protein